MELDTLLINLHFVYFLVQRYDILLNISRYHLLFDINIFV